MSVSDALLLVSSCRSKQLERTLQQIRTAGAAVAVQQSLGSVGETAAQPQAQAQAEVATRELASLSDRPASSAPLSETRDLFAPYLADNDYLRRELSLLYDRCSEHLSVVNATRPPRKTSALKLAYGTSLSICNLCLDSQQTLDVYRCCLDEALLGLGLGAPAAGAPAKKAESVASGGAAAAVALQTPMETQDLAVTLLDEFRRAFSRMQQLCLSRQELQVHASRVLELMIAAIIRDHLLVIVDAALGALSASAPASPSGEPRVAPFFELLSVVNHSIQLIDKRFEETVLPSLLCVASLRCPLSLSLSPLSTHVRRSHLLLDVAL